MNPFFKTKIENPIKNIFFNNLFSNDRYKLNFQILNNRTENLFDQLEKLEKKCSSMQETNQHLQISLSKCQEDKNSYKEQVYKYFILQFNLYFIKTKFIQQ